jgi:hypothetical protein
VGNILSDLVKPCEAPFDISMANWNKNDNSLSDFSI